MRLPWFYTGGNERRICLSISVSCQVSWNTISVPWRYLRAMHIHQLSTDFLGIWRAGVTEGASKGGSPQHLELLWAQARRWWHIPWCSAALWPFSGQMQPRCVPGSWNTWRAIGSKTQSLPVGEHEARDTYGALMLGAGTREGTAQYSAGREAGWM